MLVLPFACWQRPEDTPRFAFRSQVRGHYKVFFIVTRRRR